MIKNQLDDIEIVKPPINVLHIEDVPGDAKLIQLRLSEANQKCNIKIVDHLQLAIDLLKKHKFHVILLDLGLPDSQGLDTFNRLQESEKDTPIIILSGLADEERAIKSVSLGAQDYLAKSLIDTQLLIRTINHAIERHKLLSKIKEMEYEKFQTEIKNQFMTKATHELRTPLVSIKGYIDFILSGKLGSFHEKQRSSLAAVKRNTDRLIMLVNDILDIKRLETETNHLNYQLFDLKKTLDLCIEDMQPFLDDKNQNIETKITSDSLLIKGDETRISQTIINLLANAIKFSPENSKITICIHDLEDTIKFEVIDHGIGINEKNLKKVFDPFVEIKKPSYYSGSGLGLNICKHIIEAHGGSILAQSAGEGKGTTINFTLPKKRVVFSEI
ncbi:hypothetical protein A3K80_03775 [Candidatus Bathyarchaeota archaeon RBG_13_38_9]|nr:MAG: hypothetical protein A3K80_03775 [Candidatus Bathyarchaeota archaeon RBG_13_38_9]